MKKFVVLTMLLCVANIAHSSILWDTEEEREADKQWREQRRLKILESRRNNCQEVKSRVAKCIYANSYTGKYKLSILDEYEGNKYNNYEDFYAEIINGTNDKIALTEDEIMSMVECFHEAIGNAYVAGKTKIDYINNDGSLISIFNNSVAISYAVSPY
jgi:hypothetical protein